MPVPGYYAVLPWQALAAAATVPLALSAWVLTQGVLRFWHDCGGGAPWRALSAALSDMLTLRNLRGGGIACEQGAARRWLHHALAVPPAKSKTGKRTPGVLKFSSPPTPQIMCAMGQ